MYIASVIATIGRKYLVCSGVSAELPTSPRVPVHQVIPPRRPLRHPTQPSLQALAPLPHPLRIEHCRAAPFLEGPHPHRQRTPEAHINKRYLFRSGYGRQSAVLYRSSHGRHTPGRDDDWGRSICGHLRCFYRNRWRSRGYGEGCSCAL